MSTNSSKLRPLRPPRLARSNAISAPMQQPAPLWPFALHSAEAEAGAGERKQGMAPGGLMSASVSGQRRRRRRRRRRRPVLRQREWPCSRPIGSAYSRSPQQRRCDGVKVKDIHPFIRLAGWLAGREGEAAVVGGAFAGLSLRALCALPKSRRPKASAPAAYWPRELVQPSRLLSAGASAAGPGSWLPAPGARPAPNLQLHLNC